MLISFSVLSCSSAWIWITWAPIAVYLADMWDVPLSAVDDLSAVYMYVYVPCSFVSLYLVVNHMGLRNGLIIGGICNCIGAYLRFAYFEYYRVVYAGTFVCALAQTFTLSTPPLIAGNWFGAHERATSTSLGILSNQLGTALGLGAAVVVTFLDKTTGELDRGRLQSYLEFQFQIACIALFLVTIFAADKPLTPPSRAAYLTRGYCTKDGPDTEEVSSDDSAHNEQTSLLLLERANERPTRLHDQTVELNESPTYIESILLVFRNGSAMILVLSFGLTVGVYYTVPTFFSQLMPLSWSPRAIGWLGVAYQLVGAAGSFMAGRIIDITQSHRLITLSCLVASLTFLAVYYCTLTANLDGLDVAWLGPVAIGCAGAALSAFNTVGIELGTSMMFPADEAAMAGILESAAELGGFLSVTIGGSITDSTESVSAAAGKIVALLTCCVAVSLVQFLCIKTELKRPL
jgi:MFS family permease